MITNGTARQPTPDELLQMVKRERDDALARADASAREVAELREALVRIIATLPDNTGVANCRDAKNIARAALSAGSGVREGES